MSANRPEFTRVAPKQLGHSTKSRRHRRQAVICGIGIHAEVDVCYGEINNVAKLIRRLSILSRRIYDAKVHTMTGKVVILNFSLSV